MQTTASKQAKNETAARQKIPILEFQPDDRSAPHKVFSDVLHFSTSVVCCLFHQPYRSALLRFIHFFIKNFVEVVW